MMETWMSRSRITIVNKSAVCIIFVGSLRQGRKKPKVARLCCVKRAIWGQRARARGVDNALERERERLSSKTIIGPIDK